MDTPVTESTLGDTYMKNIQNAFLLAALCATASPSHASPIFYTTPDSIYSQNFNSLSDSTTSQTFVSGSTLTGWHVNSRVADQIAVTNGGTSIISGGEGTQGSMGTAAANPKERALGLQASQSGTGTLFIGAQFQNTTGSTLNQFSLGFTGEQWRRINGNPATTLTFEYQVFAGAGTLTAASGWTPVSALDFTSPNISGSSSALDGNDSANRTVIAPVSVGSVNWQNTNELWIRWSAPEGAGVGQHMVAVDDFSFSASVIPEPSTLVLLGVALGALALGRVRKSRQV